MRRIRFLEWRNPTGAMLWEIWARRKVNFAFHAAALLASWFCIPWLQHDPPEWLRGVLILVLISFFLGAYLDLLTCFGYIEADARKVKLGYPARLLLKPVSTLRLVLVPMFFGGAAVISVLLIWSHWIMQPLVHGGSLSPCWPGAVMLSVFWWMQALAWAMPLMPGRSLIMLIVALIHLLVGCLPLMPVSRLSGWQWPMLAGLLMSAVMTAWIGLGLMRQGNWDGPSRIARFWSRRHPARTRKAGRKFGSAFEAQFWLEWRRQGWLLPGMVAGILSAIIPIFFVVQKQVGEPVEGTSLIKIIFGLSLSLPILLSGIMGSQIARFDQLQPANELPVYIAVRPMTNGGLVIAKLAMALASSILTWLVILASAGFWIIVLESHALISLLSTISPFGIVACVIGGVPPLLLLILYTWKNLLSGIGAGLTGRRWVIILFTYWKVAVMIALIALLAAAKFNGDFMTALLHWLPGLLILTLAAKIAVAVAWFVPGMRRKVITPGGIGLIIGGWLLCGLFVAGYACLVCHALHKSDWLFPVTLGGFLLLPLPDLAMAPLALAWNRHR